MEALWFCRGTRQFFPRSLGSVSAAYPHDSLLPVWWISAPLLFQLWFGTLSTVLSLFGSFGYLLGVLSVVPTPPVTLLVRW